MQPTIPSAAAPGAPTKVTMNVFSVLIAGALALGVTLVSSPVSAQSDRSRHTDVWTFGNGCQLRWDADAVRQPLTGGASIVTGEGCTTLSDPDTGELRIYSDGNTVWNGAHVQISTGLGGDSSSLHSGVIVPAPGEPGKVFIFGHKSEGSTIVSYQRFDVTGGTAVADGPIATIATPSGREGMLHVQHANGIDSWLLASGASQIFVISITASGGVALASTVDTGLSVWPSAWHVFAASHQNDRIVMSGNSSNTAGDPAGDMATWDFDSGSGTLSNRRLINLEFRNTQFYGGVFSPDGTKFYFSCLRENNQNIGSFYQYDFDNSTFTQLSEQAVQYTHGDGRLGPDGKIYVAGHNSGGIHIVHEPNGAGTAADFEYNALTNVTGCTVRLGLPQIPSPLNALAIDLAVQPTAPILVTTPTTTVSGNANAPDGATVTVFVTGPDGFADSCAAMVTDALWGCPADTIGPFSASGEYAVSAVVTYLGETANGASTFEVALCGDGTVSGPEACDDGDAMSGNGCSDTCQVESTFTCDDSEPSLCAPMGPGLLGCSDGSREGFSDTNTYSVIASCGGAWDVPGAFHSAPECGRAAGNTGANAPGAGCNVEDLCATGWHVCHGPDDIDIRTAGQACTDAVATDYPGAAFFMTRTSGSGTGNCDEIVNGFPQSFNDIFGCGTMGAAPAASCAPLNKFGNNQCISLDDAWFCNDGANGFNEANVVVKTQPTAQGGVMCCKDSAPFLPEVCDGVDNNDNGLIDETDFFDDGTADDQVGDPCDLNGQPGAISCTGDGSFECAPVPTGACCFDTGACSVGLSTECTAAGGAYQPSVDTCADADCPVRVEICDDLIDNDDNGYVDVYDPVCQGGALTCSVPLTPAAFTIRLARSTPATYHDLFWPVSGDIDNDGHTEVLAANGATGMIDVLDGATLAVESSIPVNGDRGDNFVLANLDDDPELEVVTLVHRVNRMIVADKVGDTWVINISAPTETAYDCGGNVGSGIGLGVADFNGDGRPEIYYGNEIWTYPADLSTGCTDCITKLIDTDSVDANAQHGCYTISSGPQGMVSVVADVLTVAQCGGSAECAGPELIVAGQVFSVDVTGPSATLRRDIRSFGGGDGWGDGFAAAADLDNDGDLDIAVHALAPNGNLYAYDPGAGTVLQVWNLSGIGHHGYSPIAIADVYDEDLADDGDSTNSSTRNVPELVVSRVNLIHAVNVTQAAPVWSLAAADNSGATSLTVFDFNGDGVAELAYRDTTDMRVMYGGPLLFAPPGVDQTTRNYALFSCPSPTMNEGPAVADVDDNGAAELLVLCGSNASASLRIFESDSTPWREARRTWNQPLFNPGAINELGEVYPVAQSRLSRIPEGTAAQPLNRANAQISPLDLRPGGGEVIAAVDVSASAISAVSTSACGADDNGQTITFTITNAGDAQVSDLQIAIYTAAPSAGSTPIVFNLSEADVLVAGSLPLANGESATFQHTVATGAATSLTMVLNDDGSGGDGVPSGDVAECDLSDNIETGITCVDCSDEVCDGFDNDCDGDIDEVEDLEPVLCSVQDGACAGAMTTVDLCVDGAWQACPDSVFSANDAAYDPDVSDDICDGVDSNCDGRVDNGHVETDTTCGMGVCANTGRLVCGNGSTFDTCQPDLTDLGPETCDGRDNDCDGTTDAADDTLMLPLCDVQDGVCAGATNTPGNCQGSEGWDACGDAEYSDHSGSYDADGTDLCDGRDINCNGVIGEDHQATPTSCGMGACVASGTLACEDGVPTDTCRPDANAAGDEVCNGSDDNCDGTVDDGPDGGSVCPAIDTAITDGPDAVTAETGATFTYVDPLNPDATLFECSLDGGPWVACDNGTATYTDLPAGDHSFLVRAIGADGNPDASPAVYSWTIDTTVPDTSVSVGPTDPSQSTSATFVFACTDANPAGYFCVLDPDGEGETQFEPCAFVTSFSGLAEGEHTVSAYCVSEAGVADPEPVIYTWTVDLTAPDTVIATCPDPVVADDTYTFTFSSSDEGAVFLCRLDGGDWEECDETYRVGPLEDGPHAVDVAAVDMTGNQDPNPAECRWVVDTSEPDTGFAITPPSPSQSGSAEFAFTCTDPNPSGWFCAVDPAAQDPVFTACDQTLLVNGLADGAHTLAVYCVNAAGTADPEPATFGWVIDSTFPETEITDQPDSLVAFDDPNTFAYEDPTNPEHSDFDCRVDGGEWAPCDGGTVTLGVLPPGSHELQVRACQRDEGMDQCDPTPDVYVWQVTTSPCPLDGAAPQVSCPEDVTVSCVGGFAASDPQVNATATDSCDPVTVTDTSPETFALGDTPVVYSASDGNGNVSSCVAVVSVVDDAPPTVTCPEAVTQSTPVDGCDVVLELPLPAASDSCVPASRLTVFDDAPPRFGVGETTVTMTALDPSGQSATCTTVVTVVDDVPLVVTCPATVSQDAPSDACGWTGALEATATDNCAVDALILDESNSYAVGTHNVVFSATDASDNMASCTTALTVVDVTPPTVVCDAANDTVPAVLTATADDACGAVVTVTGLSCEDADGNTVSDCAAAVAGGTVTLGQRPTEDTTIRWTAVATDPSGNTVSADCTASFAGDPDQDNVFGDGDNCPNDANTNQLDTDVDGVGDVCDVCPDVADAGQTDSDDNGVGDACQDSDEDGVLDTEDNCPEVANPAQLDGDRDGIGSACDDDEGLLAQGGGGCQGGGSPAPWLLLALCGVGVALRRRRAAVPSRTT